MSDIIHENIAQLRTIAAEHQVKQLFIFGSVLTNAFHDESDLDFLVEFYEPNDPLEFGLLLLSFEENLAKIFHRKIDVLVTRYVKNPYLKQKIDATKVLIYEHRSEKVPA